MRSSALVVAVISLAGCGGDRVPSSPEGISKSGPPDRPIITPSTATLRVGDSLRLTVAAHDNPSVAVPAGWSSLDPRVAQVDSLTGVVHARASGTTVVKAKLASDSTQTSAVVVQVNP
jgi:hypothetical protein